MTARTPIVEDYATIRAHMTRIRDAAVPCCPLASNDEQAQLRYILNRYGIVVKAPPGGGDLGGC